MQKSLRPIHRVIEFTLAALAVQHRLFPPQLGEQRALFRQLIDQRLHLGITRTAAVIGAKFGHQAAGTFGPIGDQDFCGGREEDEVQQVAAAGFIVGVATKFRLRLEFASWIEWMKTPESHVLAIRSLQRRAGSEVADHFALEDDGSFTVDTVLLTAAAGA
nr:hypothetical protein [Rhodoferax sp. UBA5149]